MKVEARQGRAGRRKEKGKMERGSSVRRRESGRREGEEKWKRPWKVGLQLPPKGVGGCSPKGEKEID